MTETGPTVALFMPGLYGGGAERVTLTLAAGLAESGWNVDLLVVRREGELIDEIPPGVRLVDLGHQRIATSLFSYLTYLRRRQPNVVLSNLQPVNILAVLGVIISRASTKVIVTVHNTVSNQLKRSTSQQDTWKARLSQILVGRLYTKASGAVAVSKGVASDLVEHVGLERGAIDVIYNPVVTDELLKKSREPCDHEWFSDTIPVVVAVGRFVPQKDLPCLIRAFRVLRNRRRARLVVLGDGPERRRLSELVERLDLESSVDMPGFVENPVKYMARGSVFVLSSRWEGLGNVLIEALASGVPVVSTDCPHGPSEILKDGRYGRLVEVGDVEGMAMEIEATLDNPDLPATERERRNRAGDFSAVRAVERYDMMLSRVVAD